MITVINYSDDRFKNARKYNSTTAKKQGGADKVIEYGPDNLPIDIKGKYPNWSVINDPVIGRYCLWRPYIILDALGKCNEGDYVCYCDAGAYFIKPIQLLIDQMEHNNDEIMLFGLPFVEKEWTKRDVFLYFDADSQQYTDTQQILSTIFIIKKSKETSAFFEEYREAAEKMPEIFTDEDNILGKGNYSEFIANRHNQSVLSILAKKHNLNIYRDPSEYGIHPALYKFAVPNATFLNVIYNNSTYPQTIVHHRSKSVRADVNIFAFVRKYFPARISIFLFNAGHKTKYFFRKTKHG